MKPRGQPTTAKAVHTKRARTVARPMTLDDPLFKLIGSATDAAPTDSSKKYDYLADAIAPKTS